MNDSVRPKQAAIRPLIMLPAASDATMEMPNRPSTKYSGLPNFEAKAASSGEMKISETQEMMPPTKDAYSAISSAFSALPFLDIS